MRVSNLFPLITVHGRRLLLLGRRPIHPERPASELGRFFSNHSRVLGPAYSGPAAPASCRRIRAASWTVVHSASHESTDEGQAQGVLSSPALRARVLGACGPCVLPPDSCSSVDCGPLRSARIHRRTVLRATWPPTCPTRERLLPLIPLIALSILAPACGSTTAPRADRESALHRAFQEIQIREARLEKHSGALDAGRADCAAACRELRGLCAQSRAICEVARSVMDRDALARCDGAGKSCLAQSGHLARRCRCPELPEEEKNAPGAAAAPESSAGRPDE